MCGLLLAAVFAVGLLTASGQTKPGTPQYEPQKTTPTDNGGQNSRTLVISPDEDYLIGPSDVIEIKIEDAPELSGTFRLNAKGTLTLPVVGTIEVQKKTTEQIVKIIADKLRGGYLVNPIVNVTVKQSNSRAFFIQGAVRTPGIYQIEGRPSLLKLITIAGGLSENYGSTAYIMREKKHIKPEETTASTGVPTVAESNVEDAGEYDLIKANINNLLRGNLEQNIMIQPGDIVHIPQSDIFFVAGEVKLPGSFPLKEGTTLRQAISLAQGTTFEGAANQGIIFRDNESGARQEIKVDIAAIMAGKGSDVDIKPNDIIVVPNSRQKTLTKTLLKSAASTLPGLILHGLGVF